MAEVDRHGDHTVQFGSRTFAIVLGVLLAAVVVLLLVLR